MYTTAFVKEMEAVPQEVVDLINEIEVPQNLMGYNLILVSVSKILREPEFGQKITKNLYPWLGRLVEDSDKAVANRIKHAVEVTIDRMPAIKQATMFGAAIDPRTGNITNSKFLFALANAISRKQKQTAHMSGEYPNKMYTMREKMLNDLLAEQNEVFRWELQKYRNNGGRF